MLDETTREAAREIAAHYGCSASEAIRRAVRSHRDSVVGVSEEHRRQRVQALDQLIAMFDGHDAEAEIAQRKAENEFF
jgi:hypothetical protein